VDVFAALADPVRRSLLREIAGSAVRVVDLAAGRSVSRPAVSRHLRVLSDAGLVTATDRGRERLYALRPAGLSPVAALLRELGDPDEDAGGPRGGRVPAHALDALDTEVRRTSRERRTSSSQTPDQHEETA